MSDENNNNNNLNNHNSYIHPPLFRTLIRSQTHKNNPEGERKTIIFIIKILPSLII